MGHTPEEIEKAVSSGTTDYGKVKCLHVNPEKNYCLVKWPGGNTGGTWGQHISPHVSKYSLDHLSYIHGQDVWDCSKENDGRLTQSKLAQLIEREDQREDKADTEEEHPVREKQEVLFTCGRCEMQTPLSGVITEITLPQWGVPKPSKLCPACKVALANMNEEFLKNLCPVFRKQ